MLNEFPIDSLFPEIGCQGGNVQACEGYIFVAETAQIAVAHGRPVAGATGKLEDFFGRARRLRGGTEGAAKNGGDKESVQILALQLGQIAGQRVRQVAEVAACVTQDKGGGERAAIVDPGALGGGRARHRGACVIHGDGEVSLGSGGGSRGSARHRYGSSEGVSGGQVPLLCFSGLGAYGGAVGVSASIAILGEQRLGACPFFGGSREQNVKDKHTIIHSAILDTPWPHRP